MVFLIKALLPTVAIIAFCIWFGIHEYHKQQGPPRG